MTTTADDIDELHRALVSGTWQRLTEPAVDALVRDRGEAWQAIAQRCARELAVEAFSEDPDATEHLLTWAEQEGCVEIASVASAIRSGTFPGRPLHSVIAFVTMHLPSSAWVPAVRRLARQAVTRHPSPGREAALRVLERWPAE
ncbi:MAG: hypothetical protein EOO74_00340 [Myxococcales bacterium]|nr:MAG: hypothetical protein EOO74_00340 [Myxococcales bacterium]